MARSVRILLGLASFVLVAVVWLAFHDLGEPHTVRDWLTLVAAILVWVSTALAFWPVGTSAHAMGARGAS